MSKEVTTKLIFGKWVDVRIRGRKLEEDGRTGTKFSANRSLVCLRMVRRSRDRRAERI